MNFPGRRDQCSDSAEASGSSFPSIPSLQTSHFGAAAAASVAAAAAGGGGGGASPSSPLCRRRARVYSNSHDERDSGDGNVAPPPPTAAAAPADVEDPTTTTAAGQPLSVASVTTDQERQILLLMLLAQVCALHDATPRTFTVHVLELYERGLLNRESIHFLFELGLVPSTVHSTIASRGLLSNSTTAAGGGGGDTAGGVEGAPLDAEDRVVTTTTTIKEQDQLALTTTTGDVAVITSTEQLRSMETTAIRRQLSKHDQRRNTPGRKSPPLHEADVHNDENANTATPGMKSPVGDKSDKPWEVQHFPLSLSRFQREFRQMKMLNRGSFGQVFHVVRALDGCDYAIKKIAFDAMGYDSKSIEKVMREVQCLATVSDHPNVVRYFTSWLEPSWMTGGTSAAGGDSGHRRQTHRLKASETSSPQKLLQDLQHLIQHPNHEGFNASSMNSFGTETGDQSSLFERRQASVQTIGDESWESYQSHSLEAFGEAMDHSYPFSWDGESQEPQTFREAKGTKPDRENLSTYRYQIDLYIQMQLCHPATLADWIRERNRRISEAEHSQRVGPALEIFQQIVSGMAHIHEKGIVHRDVKPANIFASKDGKEVMIGDFGLSKQLREMGVQNHHSRSNAGAISPNGTSGTNSHTVSEEALFSVKKHPAMSEGVFGSPLRQEYRDVPTAADPEPVASTAVVPVGMKWPDKIVAPHHHSVANEPLTAGIGTATYAAPEQVHSKSYGTAVDIFSLGLIFLELMCCFETEHERLDWFNRIRTRQCVPQFLHDHYPDIASTILACTQPKPCDRPTARELFEIYGKVRTPSAPHVVEVHLLKRQLEAKDQQLAEKDEIIEAMRLEMEQMKAQLKNGISGTSPSGSNDVVVEDAATFDNDED